MYGFTSAQRYHDARQPKEVPVRMDDCKCCEGTGKYCDECHMPAPHCVCTQQAEMDGETGTHRQRNCVACEGTGEVEH